MGQAPLDITSWSKSEIQSMVRFTQVKDSPLTIRYEEFDASDGEDVRSKDGYGKVCLVQGDKVLITQICIYSPPPPPPHTHTSIKDLGRLLP